MNQDCCVNATQCFIGLRALLFPHEGQNTDFLSFFASFKSSINQSNHHVLAHIVQFYSHKLTESSVAVVDVFMSDAGVDAVIIRVERYERTVRVRRAGADYAEGCGASWGLGTPGITQPVRLLPGEQAH